MKRTRFYLKAAAAAVLVLALGAGAALVAVKVFFPEPRARAWFVDAARRQLGRDVRLERIDVGLRGLDLRGLEVAERPGFSAGTFLRVEDFRLRPSWRALLRRKLVIAAVSADGLRVRVVQGADGHFNYETLASSGTTVASPAPVPGGAAAPELKVRRASVSNGTVEYAAGGSSWTLTGLDLDVTDFGRPGEPFGLSASFRARGKAGTRSVDAMVSCDGAVNLGPGGAAGVKAEFKRLSVETDGLKLTATGSASGLDAPLLVFDAGLSAGGRDLLKAAGTVKLAGASALADVKWKTVALDTSLLAKYAPQAGVPPLNLPAAEGSLSGTFSAEDADVKSLSASWADGKLEGSGSIHGLGAAKPVYAGRAAFGFQSPAIAPGQYPFLRLPPELALPAARLDGEVSYKGDELTVTALTAKAAAGTVAVSGSARGLGAAKPVYEGRAAFGIDAPALAPGQYPFLHLPSKLALPAARLDGEVSCKGDDLKIASLRVKTKEGTISVEGSVRGAASAKPLPDLSVALALDLPAFKVSDLPVQVPGVPGSLAVPAGRLEGTVRASGEDATLEKVSFKAKGASILVDGKVARALAGDPVPDVSVSADLSLPALTDRDLPFPGVPAGLQMPPSRWTFAGGYSPRLIRIKSLRVLTGRNDLEASGSVTDPSARVAYDLLFKCRSFALDELTRLTPATRGLKLAGTGFFALSVTGVKDKPVYAGKLQFKGLGATVAGLPLADFTGTLTLDAHRLDVPNLKGRLADGQLAMDLTVENYAHAPEIEMEASLDRFDLGAYLAAKSKLMAQRDAARAAEPAKAAASEKPEPMGSRGHLTIGTLVHPNATVTGVKVGWDLQGLGGDLRRLNGDAQLQVGGGKVRSAADMAVQSKLVKVLIFPLLVVQKIRRIDFNDISLDRIIGDYGFKDGLMTLRRSEMDSNAAQVSAKGTIDLPKEALDLLVTAQVGNVAPIDVAVTGTLAEPKSSVQLGKFILQHIGLLNK